jgi:hypothetical protein
MLPRSLKQPPRVAQNHPRAARELPKDGEIAANRLLHKEDPKAVQVPKRTTQANPTKPTSQANLPSQSAKPTSQADEPSQPVKPTSQANQKS